MSTTCLLTLRDWNYTSKQMQLKLQGKSVLLTVIGAQVYDTLRSLLAPVKPQEKSFIELITILKQHFDPKPLVIGERFRFYRRSQKVNETVAEFQADLRKLSIR